MAPCLTLRTGPKTSFGLEVTVFKGRDSGNFVGLELCHWIFHILQAIPLKTSESYLATFILTTQ